MKLWRVNEMRAELRGLRRAERLALQAAETWRLSGYVPGREARYEEACRVAIMIQTLGDRLRARIKKERSK